MEAIAQLESELSNQSEYQFCTDRLAYSIELKDNKKTPFITGYISVPEIDLYNDLITPAALKSMLAQIMAKTITLDYEHEAWRDDNTILPVGKIVEAKVDDRGLWVKAELNRSSPKFKDLWGSIKGGFITAFSIAFKPLKVMQKTIGNATVQLIEDLKLLNVALTGSPVNEGAVMTGHSMKSVMMKAIEDTKEEKILVSKSVITKLMEEKSMEEETKTPEAPVEEVKVEEPVEPVVEAAPVEESEAAPEVVEEAKAEVETKAELELKAICEDLTKKVEAQAVELKAIKEQPVFKSTLSDNKPELKSTDKVEMLNLI